MDLINKRHLPEPDIPKVIRLQTLSPEDSKITVRMSGSDVISLKVNFGTRS